MADWESPPGRAEGKMGRRRILKQIHLVSTAWFMACLAAVFVLALHEAGFNWWVIFSLSGHSATLIFLLLSIYLFAVLETSSGGRIITIEHPLTGSAAYMVLYVSAPLLGAAAGFIAIPENADAAQTASSLALGTLATTFLTWVILDPLVSLVEVLTPAARAHKQARLAAVRAEREQKQQEQRDQLTQLLARQRQQEMLWRQTMRGEADKLATLMQTGPLDFEEAARQAIDVGVEAWRTGGLRCMRLLRDMSIESARRQGVSAPIDYVSTWWDGIGRWRSPAGV